MILSKNLLRWFKLHTQMWVHRSEPKVKSLSVAETLVLPNYCPHICDDQKQWYMINPMSWLGRKPYLISLIHLFILQIYWASTVWEVHTKPSDTGCAYRIWNRCFHLYLFNYSYHAHEYRNMKLPGNYIKRKQIS